MQRKAALKRYYKEVFFIQPNNLNNKFLDYIFHKFVPYLKHFPFAVLFPFSLLISLALVFFFKNMIVYLVSFFQYGF